MGFKMSNVGYIDLGRADSNAEWYFKSALCNDPNAQSGPYYGCCNDRFDMIGLERTIIPYSIDYEWLDDAISAALKILNCDVPPQPSDGCKVCQYHYKIKNVSNI